MRDLGGEGDHAAGVAVPLGRVDVLRDEDRVVHPEVARDGSTEIAYQDRRTGARFHVGREWCVVGQRVLARHRQVVAGGTRRVGCRVGGAVGANFRRQVLADRGKGCAGNAGEHGGHAGRGIGQEDCPRLIGRALQLEQQRRFLAQRTGAHRNHLGRFDDIGRLAAFENQHTRRIVVGDRDVDRAGGLDFAVATGHILEAENGAAIGAGGLDRGYRRQGACLRRRRRRDRKREGERAHPLYRY